MSSTSTPIIHSPHGTDANDPKKSAPGAPSDGKPIIHKSAVQSDEAEPVIHFGMKVSDLYDLLEAEGKARADARADAAAESAPAKPAAAPAAAPAATK